MIKDSEILNKRFTRLLVLHEVPAKRKNCRRFQCVCDCGKRPEVDLRHLRSGLTTSCGCLGRENSRESAITHGLSKTAEYKIWRGMKSRCNLETVKEFCFYGGRGIKVCDAWENSFEQFFLDMGPKPFGFSIERIDVNGNYEPSNCKWIPREHQILNTRATVFLEYAGQRLTQSQWAQKTGLSQQVIYTRLRRGWSIERTLETPKLA